MPAEFDGRQRPTHGERVGLRRLANSPLAVIGVACGALCAWTCAYQSAIGQTGGETRDQAVASAATSATRVAGTPLGLARLGGVRLLRDPSPDQPFGLDVALDGAGATSMLRFHDALRRAAAGEGQARIVVYGASHVAADVFTGRLRRELQGRFGDAGAGFVLPAHPWPSYRHGALEVLSSPRRWRGEKVRATSTTEDWYGLAGVYVETNRPGAWGAVVTQRDGAAGLYDLYYLEQPNGGSFEVFIDGRRSRRVATRAATRQPGYATFRVTDGPHRFEVRAIGDGPVRLFGVAVERERPGVIVDTLGINGARARSHLLWNDSLYREHLRRRSPDLVVLAYGTNESGDDSPIAQYEEELRQVVQRVRDTVPEASCLLIGPSDRPVQLERDVFEDRPRTAALIDVQRRVSADLGCAFFDVVAFQGGPLATVDWAAADPPFAQPDHVHFTVRGYQRMGEALLGALLERFDEPGDAPATTFAGR